MDASLLDTPSISPGLSVLSLILASIGASALVLNILHAGQRKEWLVPLASLLVIVGAAGAVNYLVAPNMTTTQAGTVFDQQLEQVYGATTDTYFRAINRQLEEQDYADLVLKRDGATFQAFLTVGESGMIQLSTATGKIIEPIK